MAFIRIMIFKGGEVLCCCVHFDRGAIVTVVCRQVVVVVVAGVVVNVGGKVLQLLFNLVCFLRIKLMD